MKEKLRKATVTIEFDTNERLSQIVHVFKGDIEHDTIEQFIVRVKIDLNEFLEMEPPKPKSKVNF